MNSGNPNLLKSYGVFPCLYMNNYQDVSPVPFKLRASIFSNCDIRHLIRVIMYKVYITYLIKFQEWISYTKIRKRIYIDM